MSAVHVEAVGVAERSRGRGRRRGPARVVHVPAGHDYVCHATTLPGTRGPAVTSGSDPFAWRDGVGWLARHGPHVDVLHVHFGAEQLDHDGLAAVLDAAEQHGVAMVWTVHDLTNPHLRDQSLHEAQSALLARRCAGLVTLTPGAAAAVDRRWGRRPVVVPHPHLAPLAVLAGRRRPAAGRPVVGVPVGTLRPGTDPAVVRALLGPAVREALQGASDHGAVLRVTVREEVLRPGFPRPDDALVRLLQDADDAGRVELVVAPRTPDAALWDELAGLAALVLPYRWGTHSGWVEACHDVGTPVVAPALGHWGEQHPVHAFRAAPDGPDPASLAHAVAGALAQGPRHRPVLAERLQERAASAAEHARLHAVAAAGGRW